MQNRQNTPEYYNHFLINEMQRLAHLGSWQIDLATNRIAWSAEAANIYGIDAQCAEAAYEDFLGLVHPEERVTVDSAYRASVQGREGGFEIDHRIIKAGSGEIRYVHEKCIHERDQDGNVIRSTGIVQDLTERTLAAAALRESEARFRLLAENSNDMISHHDAQGNYLYVTPSCRILLGYEPEEMLGHSAFEFVHPEDTPSVEQSRVGIIEQPAVSTTTFRARKKTGELVWLETTSRTIVNPATGDIQGIHAVSRDVSERKHAEERLNEARANMQAIIENTLDNIWAVSTTYEILYTNVVFSQAFQAAFGIPLAPGVNILEALPEVIRPVWKERYDRAFCGERFIFVDAVDAGGMTIHIEVAVNPIVNDGKVVGASFFGRDVTFRKQSEQALNVALAKYKTLFETFPMGISVTDETGSILETNAVAEKLLSLQQEDHLQRDIDSPAWHIIREDGTPMPPAEFAGAQALQQNRLVEHVRMGIQKPDDTVIWLDVTAAPLPIPGYGVVITYGDITERKKMEDALRIKEWAISDSINAIALADLAGRLTYVNPAFLAMWGYESDTNVLGRLSTEFWQSDNDASDVLSALQQYGHWRGEMVGKHRDGSFFLAEVSASQVLDESGKPLSLLGVFEDTTQRKKAEEALRQSEALYRQAIMASGAVPYRQSYRKVSGKSTQMLFDFIGNGIEELTGYTPDEFNDALWDELIQESFLVEELAGYEWLEAISLVRSGELPVWKCEHRIRARDGSTRWVFEAAVEMRDQKGDSYGSIGLFQDITVRKLAEERILQLNVELEKRVVERTAQLEQANSELESFSYSVSHDLRAPLRAIDGYSRILYDQYAEQLTGEGQALLGYVRSSANRMGALIDDLLEFSRLGRQPLRTQLVNMDAIVQAALDTLNVELENPQLQINIHPLPACQGDPSLLTQVWVNLLSNALKYTRRSANAQIEVGSYEEDKACVYFVKDSGVGFDMRYAHKLFGVFQRLHSDSEFEGTGVGLALVHRIINRHGGRIWAESEPGKGATFYFTLVREYESNQNSRLAVTG